MDNRRRMLMSGGISADPVLENNDWATISAISKAGLASAYWKVGDCKNITIGGTIYPVQIIGFDHDNVTNSASYGRAKAGITFQMVNCYATVYKMNDSSTNIGGWKSSVMRTSTMATMKSYLSSDVQSVIEPVNKVAGVGNGSSSSTETVSDSCFLLAEIEIFGSTTYSVSGEGTQYAYYKAGNSKVKNKSGSAYDWWERSPRSGYNNRFCFVNSGGSAGHYNATNSIGVAFAFCV